MKIFSKTLNIPGRKCTPPPPPRGREDLRCRLPNRLEATEALEAVGGEAAAAGGAPGAVILPGVMSPHD